MHFTIKVKICVGRLTVCYLGWHTVENFLHSGSGMQEASTIVAQNLLKWTLNASEVGSSIFIVC